MSIPDGLMVLPADDAGAQTLNRYHWQAWIATSHCLAAIAELWDSTIGSTSEPILVVCEHIEDFIVCRGEGFVLVNVKHRDLPSGAWTWATLFEDGGMRHLFERWFQYRDQARACFATNAALATGDPAQLHDICAALRDGVALTDPQRVIVRNFGDRIWSGLDAAMRGAVSPGGIEGEFRGIVDDFLAALMLSCESPNRNDMPFAAPSMFMEPLLALMGKDTSLAPPAWKALVGLVVDRMQGRGAQPLGAMQAMVAQYRALSGVERLRAAIEARVLSLEDVIETIQVVEHAGLRVVSFVSSVPSTRLSAKLINGGCSDTTAFAAESAALAWRKLEAEASARDDIPMTETLARARVAVSIAASQIYERTRSTQDFGPEMWQTLVSEAAALDLGLDGELALGAACDLASQCKVWFSERFDVDAAIAALPNRILGAAA